MFTKISLSFQIAFLIATCFIQLKAKVALATWGAYINFHRLKQLRVLLPPPAWDASASQVNPSILPSCPNSGWYAFVHLGGERHCKCYPRQHTDHRQPSKLDNLIWNSTCQQLPPHWWKPSQHKLNTSWKMHSDGNVRETSIMMSSTVWALLTTGWSLAGSSATVCVGFFFLLSRVVKSLSYAWDWNMSNSSAKGTLRNILFYLSSINNTKQ